MDLAEINKLNLKGLWRQIGLRSGQLIDNQVFSGVYLPKEEWPNRIWLRDETEIENWEQALAALRQNPQLGLSSFQSSIAPIEGLTEQSRQYGMIRKRERKNSSSKLKLKRVNTRQEASQWAQLFHHSFSYSISEAVVFKNQKLVEFYLGMQQSTPVGTLMLYADKDSLGLHSMGIPPQFRRKGLATELMLAAFELVKDRPQEHLVLQASEIGKGLYLKLGFKEHFLQLNFKLSTETLNHE